MKITLHCLTRFAQRVLKLDDNRISELNDQRKRATIQFLALATLKKAGISARGRNGYVCQLHDDVVFVVNPEGDTVITCYVARPDQAEWIKRRAA
jgi:hypothetical protein